MADHSRRVTGAVHTRQVALLALGTNLVSAQAGGGLAIVAGTSFATAVTSGVAGLLLSLALRYCQPVTGPRVRQILLDSAAKCFDDALQCRRHLSGRLDLIKASALIRAGDIAMSDPMLMPHGSSEAPLAEPMPPTGLIQHAATPALAAQLAAPQRPHVVPSEGCGCASCRAATSTSPAGLVFALGEIGYDLVSEARRDSIQQHMGDDKTTPTDPAQLLDYLAKNPWEAASILWTLSNDQTAIYVLTPGGPFATETYARLREFLAEQLKGKVDRVSIPGRLMGQAQLSSGQILPVVVPELRGMFSWTTDALLTAIVGAPPPAQR